MIRLFTVLSSICFFLTTISLSHAQTTWTPLFGSNLAEAVYDSGAWSLEGGVLTAEEDDCIWSADAYENFELDLEFRNEPGTNSGVIIYCTDLIDWIPNSVEIQIADDYYEPWSEAESHQRCAAIYGHLGPQFEGVVKQPGEWNHMRIRCTGQRISVILNGKKMTEMNMALWTSGTINPDGSEIPAWLPTPFAELPTKGYIGLQGKHGGASVSFRNIKIREVKDQSTVSPTKIEREERILPQY